MGSIILIVSLSVFSSFMIISPSKRELVALLYLCSCCCVVVYSASSLTHGAVGWSVVCECDIY